MRLPPMRHIVGATLGLLLVAVVGLAQPAFAQANQEADAAPLRFDSPAEEARFHDLTLQLRCVMCQNQSLADSHAMIALQLRREVLDLMREGRSDDDIKAFLVQRYGEFVLYKPPLEGRTWLLWAGPAVILLIGAGALVAIVRRHRPADAAATVTGGDSDGDSDDSQEW